MMGVALGKGNLREVTGSGRQVGRGLRRAGGTRARVGAGFAAEGIEGGEAAGLGAVFGEFGPPEGGLVGVAEEKEAVFAGQAGAGDAADAAAQGVKFGEAVGVGEFGVGSGDVLVDRGGVGALNGEGGAVGGGVFEGDAGGEVGVEQGESFGGGGGEEPGARTAAIEEEVARDGVARAAQAGGLAAADGEAGWIGCQKVVEPTFGVGPADAALGEMGDIEDAAVAADREVFLGKALEGQGEDPSGEGREVGAALEVVLVQGRKGEGSVHLGREAAARGLSTWMGAAPRGLAGRVGKRLPGRPGGAGWGMSEPVLVVENVRRLFGKTVAVSDLSFEVGKGEVVGLLGANGAGKTTAISIILGLMTPSAGRVRLFGMDPFKQRIAVLQRANYASAYSDLPSNLYVWQNLKVFAGIYRVRNADRKIDELLEMLEISHLKKRVTGHLSAGESTRLHLCKALLNDPELLMLDEPTASLDPDIADKVRKLLRRVQEERGLSILYTSHNMRDIEEVCDRVLFMHQGKIVAQGSPAEVIAKFDETTMENVFIRIVRGGDLEAAAAT